MKKTYEILKKLKKLWTNCLNILCALLLYLTFGELAQAANNHPVVKDLKPACAAVVTSHPIATATGMRILHQGGNAFDATIAISAALGVVEPYGSGLGGGGFYLLHIQKTQQNIFIDARERAPFAASVFMFSARKNKNLNAKRLGPLAAAIPGEPAGLVYIAKHYARLSLPKDLTPAIQLAKTGFKVYPLYQSYARLRLHDLRKYPATAHIFLLNGQIPPLGYRLKQPDLAKVLENIAKYKNHGFYSGETAHRLVRGTRQAGGIWSNADLNDYPIIVRQPLVGYYHGIKIITAPPPSAGGIIILTILNLLNQYDLTSMPEARRKHLIIEAMKRAYVDRTRYVGDPDDVDVPVEYLLSPQHTKQLSSSISLQKATPSIKLAKQAELLLAQATSGYHTTHFSVIDREGNWVAATISLNSFFGSGFVVPGTGILLNDQMDDFSTHINNKIISKLSFHPPNLIAPGKRPLSHMTPTFLIAKDRIAILGTPGGPRIPTMILLAILDFAQGHGPYSWNAVPRYHHQFMPDIVEYEQGRLSKSMQTKLKAMGHHLQPVDPLLYGNMQSILWDQRQQKIIGASDMRKSGLAENSCPFKLLKDIDN